MNCEYATTQDARSDSPLFGFTVPCCLTPRADFDWMGYTMRLADWRYTLWCKWNGVALTADWANGCGPVELYDHTNDSKTVLFDPDNEENANVAGRPEYAAIQARLDRRLRDAFARERKRTRYYV